jgi:hypothetical protein
VSAHAAYRLSLAHEFWNARYERYTRDCAAWGIQPHTFDDFKAYWEMFAKEGELAPQSAPILVQRR